MANTPDIQTRTANLGGSLEPVEDTAFLESVGIQDEPASVWSSFFAGASSSNLIMEGVRAITSDHPEFEPTENYNPLNDIFDDQSPAHDFLNLVETDDAAAEVLLTANSQAELLHLGGQIKEKYERLAIAMDNSVAGIGGMLVGGMFDITAVLPVLATVKAARLSGRNHEGGEAGRYGAHGVSWRGRRNCVYSRRKP